MKPYFEDPAGIQIWNCDCREVLAQLAPVDHVITDPPYARAIYMRMRRQCSLGTTGAARVTGSSGLVAMRQGAIGLMEESLMAQVSWELRFTKRWTLIFSDVESIHEWRQWLEKAGLRYVRTGAWIKGNPMPQMTGDRPAVGFEPVTICHAQGKMRWNAGGHAAVWRYYSDQASPPLHPCPKPLDLMHKLVEQFTDPGETILDPFAGSGTTLVAAKNLGRKAIGIEREERYAEIAVKRLSQSVFNFGAASHD